jgi:opacity protein-like surface antigen
MKLRSLIAAGAVALGFSNASALAADIVPIVPAPPPVVVVPAAPGFDWSGLYLGAYAGYNIGIPEFAVGATAGFNIVRNRLLFGAEVRVGVFFPGEGPTGFDLHLEGLGRTGFLIGDRLLAYGTAGVGTVFCCGFTYWFAGGGVELGMGERLSIFGEVRAYDDIGDFSPQLMLRTGVNFHL